MSSLVDAVISSDLANADQNDLSSQERDKLKQRQRLQERPASSTPRPSSARSRARGPLSESAGAVSDIDDDGFLDDDDAAVQAALKRRRPGTRPDVPRIVDKIGETIARRFEDFLEK